MVKLLEKGIAVHHSGILPVLREMIEMMFDKGYIKLLIATETFAVGLNMPTKTVVFTNLTKFDGSTSRYLMSHEYTQQAGRAGRRGYDTKGVVIHLNNMFALPTPTEYRHILSGTPQKLVSKFKMSFNMILNMQYMKMEHVDTFAKKSILNSDIGSEVKSIQNEIEELDTQIEQNKQFTTNLRTSKEDIMKTIELEKTIPTLKNKHRKNGERELAALKDMNKYMAQDRKVYDSLFKFEEQKAQAETQLESTESYISASSNKVAMILKNGKFIEEDNSISITGKLACHIQEIHCLAFTDTLVHYNYFTGFTYQEIVGILSCFTNVKVGDDYKAFTIETENTTVKSTITHLSKRLDYYYDQEVKNVVFSGSDYTIHYDLINYMMEWCECSNETESKLLIQKLQTEKSVFLGEFIKSILKVNNIANELEKIANYLENVELLSKLSEIKNNTLKFVATTQSLYV
jgi:superfamily II RNA helicase